MKGGAPPGGLTPAPGVLAGIQGWAPPWVLIPQTYEPPQRFHLGGSASLPLLGLSWDSPVPLISICGSPHSEHGALLSPARPLKNQPGQQLVNWGGRCLRRPGLGMRTLRNRDKAEGSSRVLRSGSHPLWAPGGLPLWTLAVGVLVFHQCSPLLLFRGAGGRGSLLFGAPCFPLFHP